MSIELSPQQGAAKAALDDAELVRRLRDTDTPMWVSDLVAAADRIEALIAARDAALEEAAKVAAGRYRSHSQYSPESVFYGMDLTPDRSNWGRGVQRGREEAAAAIRALKGKSQ